MKIPKPVLLAILDGWGHADGGDHNAIEQAQTPVWDALNRDYPHDLINASELHVGLPSGQMGNSEVGHMNIGSGRVVMQDLPKIDGAIADGSLAGHPHLAAFIATLKESKGTCHLLGLLSPGGVHAHQHHIAALAKIIAAHNVPVCIHAFLDGRDTPPQSALEYLEALQKELAPTLALLPQGEVNSIIRIATISGRYFAMDRDKRWDRVEQAYNVLVSAEGKHKGTPAAAIEQSYTQNVTDEFILPVAIGDYTGMKDGDGLLMANFRADRAREILDALLDPAFSSFPRTHVPKFSVALGMVEYSTQLNAFMPALFPAERLHDILGEIVSNAKLKQLRIAETEKYAHVTFFFNGGREQEYPGEERILIPSPKVATYDLKPEMSAYEVTQALEEAIAAEKFDLIVVNYANTDMVGHSGNIEAAKKAVETVDTCLGRITQAVLAKGGAMLITADHGNAESMFDHETDQAHTAHTLNLVPVVLVADGYKGKQLVLPEPGRLADVAPTVLSLLQIPQPAAMTGHSLLPFIRA